MLFGESLEGSISISSFINQNENSSEYTNFNQVPVYSRLIMFLFMTISISLIITILKYWKNFMSLVYKGRCFEINTIKNLRFISYLLSGIWTILLILKLFTNTIVSTSFSNKHNLSDKNIAENIQSLESVFIFPPMSFLIIAMMLWILSHILIEGIKIKEENKLTI
jgi:hypothetical protein